MTNGTRCTLGVLALLISLPAFGIDTPGVPQQARIKTSGEGPYFRLDLPIAVYPGAAHPDLRDIRIRNASGNPVPHAWLNNEAVEVSVLSRAVAFYPLVQRRPGTKPSDSDAKDVSMEFAQKADGSLTLKTSRKPASEEKVDESTDWIIDASQIKGQLLQVRVSLDDSAEGLFPVSIEGSDDLRYWRAVNDSAQIAILKRPDRRVEKLTVDLRASQARFLRLRWNDTVNAPRLTSVTLDSVEQNALVMPLQWSPPIRAATCGADSCEYVLPANTPLDGLRLKLAETNTLASITVSAQSSVPVPPNYHRHRHPLYLLRHKRSPAVTPTASTTTESVLTQAVVYRLKLANGELHSDSIVLGGGIHDRLRIQTEGPISLLGQPLPALEIASLQRSLIFLGRGSPPFTLHWGVDDKQETALPLATLVPGQLANVPLAADRATVEVSPPPRASSRIAPPAKAPSTTTPQAKKAPAPQEAPQSGDKRWLWAALAVGLVILGGMAWSLFRGMSKPEPAQPE